MCLFSFELGNIYIEVKYMDSFECMDMIPNDRHEVAELIYLFLYTYYQVHGLP